MIWLSLDFLIKSTMYDPAISCGEPDSPNFPMWKNVNSGFSSPRINLSPFTKDFRGEEQYNESID